jgi:hypothetical protein
VVPSEEGGALVLTCIIRILGKGCPRITGKNLVTLGYINVLNLFSSSPCPPTCGRNKHYLNTDTQVQVVENSKA